MNRRLSILSTQKKGFFSFWAAAVATSGMDPPGNSVSAGGIPRPSDEKDSFFFYFFFQIIFFGGAGIHPSCGIYVFDGGGKKKRGSLLINQIA